MKSIKLILSYITVFLLVFACEDALDEVPITSLSEDQLFSSENGVETAINGLYKSFSDPAYHGSAYHGLLAPHSGKFYSSQGASEDATSLNSSTSNTWLQRMWPQMYTTINVANVIINNLENTNIELENKEIALGQAYFIRAATYFDLVRLFGGVPIKTAPSTNETLHTPRSPKSEVYDLIIADFEIAKQMLPDFGEYLSDRPVKFAANMYLSKVYMQMAGEDGGDPSLWTNALEEALQVSGKYSLTSNYNDFFKFISDENSIEAIFEIQYGSNGAINNSQATQFYTPSNSEFAPDNVRTFGRVKPNKEVYDQHVAQYPNDPRIDAIFVDSSYVRNGSERTVYPLRTNGNDGYAYITKYFDRNWNGSTTDRNFIKLRYADLLLMLAEIENEINGPGDAYKYVNQVLERARNSNEDGEASTEPANWSGMSQDEFRERILRERQYELLGEGHEWYDTRRRGYEYFLNEVVYPHNNNPTFDSGRDFVYPVSIKNMLLPIPLVEISGNQAISQGDQNPGY